MSDTMFMKIAKPHIVEGVANPGEEIGIHIDQCLTQDSTGTMCWLEFESLGLPRIAAELVVSYSDHTSLCYKGESSEDHVFLQSIASHYGALYSRSGNGVCHQIHYERFAVPGKTLLGADSHTPTAGGLGMLAIGAGGMDVAVAIGGSPFFLQTPRIINVILDGKLPPAVGAKDIALEVLKRLTVRGGFGHVLEYTGSAVGDLTIPERCTICNMSAETGATSSIFPSDEITRRFMIAQNRGDNWTVMEPDEEAIYDQKETIDLSTLQPLIALPGSPDNVVPISDIAGRRVDQVYVGSCTNGSYQDIKRFSDFLGGNRVSTALDVIVSPGSRQALEMLIEDGTVLALTRAGVRIIEPGCNACIGMGFVPGTGHFALRTVNRNWKGRGGNKSSEIALCGPEVAAATALEGRMADPRQFDVPRVNCPPPSIADYLILEPQGEREQIRRGKNIVPLAKQKPLNEVLEGEVLLKLGDGVTTDAIIPAGPLTQHLRSNLPETARFTFHYEDAEFASRALERRGGFIVAGENYGQGSSREHAALAPWQLGIRCVIAKGFARIHRDNLVNAGIVPLVADTSDIQQGDLLRVDIGDLGGKLTVEIVGKEKSVPAQLFASARQTEVLLAGGLLAYSTREGNF